MRFLLCLLAMALLCGGCQRDLSLSCRSEYLYPEYLAGEQIALYGSSSPCFYGQQVVIYWRCCPPAELRLHVRYGTGEQENVSWCLSRSHGYHIYRLLNEEYWSREGIVSYKAELYQDGELLADWSHYLWADLIQLNGSLDNQSPRCLPVEAGVCN